MALPVNIDELINGRVVETDAKRSYFASILSTHPQSRLKVKKDEPVSQ